ncbi:oxidoreductase [Lithospermum erythrorhizon]|uniref:Oxidoreductase n=1 Tax=Lithospermum erythrorhizon TaxID=34254 RepID=A0AAV3NNV0_LITER
MGHQQCDKFDDIVQEVQVFEATKAGIKGLVDSGIKKLPRFCIQQSETSPKNPENGVELPQVPLVDLEGFEDGVRRAKIVEEIRKAAEEWGPFQIINHGVPQDVMDGILQGTKRFHEQPNEAKKELYS